MDRVFRKESGRAVAALIRVFGDVDVAEDAVQDAFAQALVLWPSEGFPSNPFAWIVAAGRHRAIDRLRRESLGRALLAEVVQDRAATASSASRDTEPLDDDPLRLIFMCCHPALSPEAQVALTLRLLGGLSTAEIARAFLVTESTMAQRLVRAKRKIKSAHIPYRVPSEPELPERLQSVLAVVYLIYNEGAARAAEQDRSLCEEALRLARLLRELMPAEAEVAGLLALLLFNESRREARFAKDGSVILLRDQDRRRWDQALIAEGHELLRFCEARGRPDVYQFQAAIQATHAEACTVDRTNWRLIVGLYDRLLHRTRSPVVAMNRAIAVAEVRGPDVALGELEDLKLDGYYLFHATRGDFLDRLDRSRDAAEAYSTALRLAPTRAEQRVLQQRLDRCASR